MNDASRVLQRVNQNPELIPRFEHLLEEWCNQIERYLDPPERYGYVQHVSVAFWALAIGVSFITRSLRLSAGTMVWRLF